MIIIIYVVEVLSFAALVVSAMKYFKKEGSDKRQKIIQLVGTLQIILSLVVTKHVDNAISISSIVFFTMSLAMFFLTYNTTKSYQFNFAFSPSHPTHLIDKGPYALIRHPYYFSFTSAWIGACLATNFNPVVILNTVVLIALYFQAMQFEENQFLNSSLAERYSEYAKRTKRILPFIY